MLFVSGSRDALADMALLEPLVGGLGERATLHVVDGGDHALRALGSSGRPLTRLEPRQWSAAADMDEQARDLEAGCDGPLNKAACPDPSGSS